MSYDYTTIHLHTPPVTEFQTLNDCKRRDYWTEQDIKRLQSEIERLQAYRLELAKRAQEIIATPYHWRVLLKRERSWRDSPVKYRLSLQKVYDGDSVEPETVEFELYAGKERSKAIARFKAIQKERPGIEAVQDIERKAWER